LSLIASDAHSLRALWFTGGIFWTIKLLLAYFLFTRPRGNAVVLRPGLLTIPPPN
jgi:hypothetical protein